MSWLAVFVGCLLVVLVTLDVLRTTMTLDGSGRLASMVTRGVTGAMKPLRRRQHPQMLQGPLLLFCQTALWVLLSWAGWMVIFCSFDGAVVDAETEASAHFWSRAYYVGFSMVTLGNGEFMPGSHVWQFFTVCAAAHGFILITLAVSYFIPVLDGVHTARVLALQVYDLGCPSARALSLAYDGDGYSRMSSALASIAERGLELDRSIRAHPVVLSFYTRSSASLPVAIAHLDDVVLLLEHAVEHAPQPSAFELAPIRAGINRLVERVANLQRLEGEEELPPPDPSTLDVPRRTAEVRLDGDGRRRRANLRSWLEHSGEFGAYWKRWRQDGPDGQGAAE